MSTPTSMTLVTRSSAARSFARTSLYRTPASSLPIAIRSFRSPIDLVLPDIGAVGSGGQHPTDDAQAQRHGDGARVRGADAALGQWAGAADLGTQLCGGLCRALGLRRG